MSFGCVIVDDDDDDNDSGNDNADDGQPSATDDGVDDGVDDGGSTAAADDADDDGGSTAAGDETAADESTGSATPLCGWGTIEDAMVTEGYTCGGDGEDPNGNIALACPEIELVDGAECPSTIEGEGCCDGDTVWFCGLENDGTTEVLVSIACE